MPESMIVTTLHLMVELNSLWSLSIFKSFGPKLACCKDTYERGGKDLTDWTDCLLNLYWKIVQAMPPNNINPWHVAISLYWFIWSTDIQFWPRVHHIVHDTIVPLHYQTIVNYSQWQFSQVVWDLAFCWCFLLRQELQNDVSGSFS